MRTRLAVVGGVGALLMLAAVVASGRSAVPVGEGRQLFEFLQLPTLAPISVNNPPPAQTRQQEALGGWADVLGWFVLFLPLVVLGVLILLALVLAWRARGRRSTPVRVEEEVSYDDPAATRLVRAVRAALVEFDRHEGGPPGDAVIAAWLELEAVAATIGTARLAHQTPTEFTDELRAGHQHVDHALDRLRGLYQRARFGPPGAVGRAEADAARAALDEILRALTAEPVPR